MQRKRGCTIEKEKRNKKSNAGLEGLGKLIKWRWYEEVDETIVRSGGKAR